MFRGISWGKRTSTTNQWRRFWDILCRHTQSTTLKHFHFSCTCDLWHNDASKRMKLPFYACACVCLRMHPTSKLLFFFIFKKNIVTISLNFLTSNPNTTVISWMEYKKFKIARDQHNSHLPAWYSCSLIFGIGLACWVEKYKMRCLLFTELLKAELTSHLLWLCAWEKKKVWILSMASFCGL